MGTKTLSAPMERLTPMERKTRDQLIDCTAKLGRAPSLQELADHMGLTKAGAQRHMDALKRKGAVLGPRVVGNWRVTRAGKKMS